MKNIRRNKIMSAAIWLIVLLFGTNLIISAQTPTPQVSETRELAAGQTIEREMTGAQTHRYTFDLRRSEFFQVRVEQKGIDVSLKLTDAGGKTLATMESPNGKEGPETLSFAALTKGTYFLEIGGFDIKAGSGIYVMTRQPARMATPLDKKRVRIERLFVESVQARKSEQSSEIAVKKWESVLTGWEELKDAYLIKLTSHEMAYVIFDDARTLAGKGTAESGKSAISKFEAAGKIYRKSGDKQSEADCLGWIGSTYSSLGEKQKALYYDNQALLLYRAVDGKSQEALMLSNIGSIYKNSGEKQKALEYYKQTLPLRRAVNDKSGEAQTLNYIGLLYYDLSENQKALEYYNQSLSIARSTDEKNLSVSVLYNIGAVYDDLGEKQKALDFYNQSLTLSRAINSKSQEATLLNSIGLLYSDLGENQKALEYYNQSLSIARSTDEKKLIVSVLYNIGAVYDDLGEKQKALDFYNQSLTLSRAINSKSQEAKILNSIGGVYDYLGEKQKALEFYNRSLTLFRAAVDKSGEALLLNNIGFFYDGLGEKQKALEYYNQSLLSAQAIKDQSQTATALHNIGGIYSDLGDNQKALDYYNQSLPLARAVGDKSQEANTLSDIGLVYSGLGDNQKALDYYNQSLPLSRAVGDKSQEANTLSNIGGVYDDLEDKQKALEYYIKSLPLSRAAGDKSQEAFTLTNIGTVYDDLNDEKKALEYFQTSLPISRAIGDKDTEAYTLNFLRYYWNKLKNPRLAVFYGKQAINIYQLLRSNISKLDKKIQKTYLKTHESKYRRLADILIAEGRIAEAEQVLGMLKEDEYLSYLRRDDAVAKELKGRISLSPDEKQAFEDYEKYSAEITRTAEEFGILEKKKNALPLGESLSAADRKQYDALKARYDAAVTVFSKYLDDLKVKFASKGDKSNQIAAIESDTIGLLKKLDQPRTVIISTIVGEDHLNLIVTTSDIQKAHTVEIKAEDLNKLVADFRDAVKNPKVDPRPLGKQLYDKLFPAELQKDLANIKADTIVWSLDGTLRYVPMAALWDGRQYLVERYTTAVLTLASRDKLAVPEAGRDRTKWLAFGVGVSKPFGDFNALPAVPQELCGVVNDAQKKQFCRSIGSAGGAVKGLLLADDEFTLTGFQNNLGKTAIVHIASHFSLNAGNETDSYLLLGGGEQRRFSLDNLKKTRLDNVELLTLSACNTAMTSGRNSSGVEIEGFGALAQKQGAKTVLATLWAVADDSTKDLMTGFYRTLEASPQLGKADALRQTQLRLLNGDYTSEEATKKRGTDVINLSGDKSAMQPAFKADKNAPFAHPYYWSPFILFGNWQ